MPHWSARVIISFLFSPKVAIPVVLAAVGIAFTLALAPTTRNVRLAHWFFAIAGIWAYGGVLRSLAEGDVAMKYLISFFSCGLVGTLWLASYRWVEGNYREQVHAQQQDRPTESNPDKKNEDKKKDTATQKRDDKHKSPSRVTQESHGDNSPNTGSITQGPGSIAQVGGKGNQATVFNFGPPRPQFELTTLRENVKVKEDLYQTDFRLVVKTESTIQFLFLRAEAQSVTNNIFMVPEGVGISSTLKRNTRGGPGFISTNVEGVADGMYIISTFSTQPDKITLSYDPKLHN